MKEISDREYQKLTKGLTREEIREMQKVNNKVINIITEFVGGKTRPAFGVNIYHIDLIEGKFTGIRKKVWVYLRDKFKELLDDKESIMLHIDSVIKYVHETPEFKNIYEEDIVCIVKNMGIKCFYEGAYFRENMYLKNWGGK